MAVLDIKIIPNSVLRSPTKEVGSFEESLHRFLDDMYETMVHAGGLGLAAPQVGDLRKIAIIDLTVEGIGPPALSSLSGIPIEEHVYKGRLEMINPEITKAEIVVPSDEGCLSIPDYRDSIKRKEQVTMRAVDRHGRAYEVDAADLLAFAIQHELDHLNGVLFTDHLSRLKKQLFMRWCKKHLGIEGRV
jgi:peptide deformylase